MNSNDDKKRIYVEEDRLSSLPDDIIHKILSFIGIRNAIKTSALSSRWRFIWTSLPYLDFSNEDFPTRPKFSQFVTHVLSHRNNLAEIFSIKIFFNGNSSQDFVKQNMNYAFSHNIQQLDITYLIRNDIEFPLSLFSSRSLKHLSLTNDFDSCSSSSSLTATSIWELPALTTLYLYDITLCDDNNDMCVGLFSKCVNLKTLTLEKCRTKGSNSLSICHPRLSNLTIDNDREGWEDFSDLGGWKDFYLVAPQLKNLTIRILSREHYWISAPELASLRCCDLRTIRDFHGERYRISALELTSLHYIGYSTLLLSADGDFRSLETVDLNVYSLIDEDAPVIFSMFQWFQSVKYLTLNLEILELLSSYEELNLLTPSPYANLKSLKICPLNEHEIPDDEDMSMKVKDYFLNNSPNATFTMVSREEIQDMKNTKLAQARMAKLQVVLEQEKARIESNMARIEQEKLQVENQQQVMEKVAYINKFHSFLTEEISKGTIRIREIKSKLNNLKRLLQKLPTSINAEMKPCVFSLSTEADTVLGNIRYYIKTKGDMKRFMASLTGAYYNELASTSQSSS